MKMERSLQQLLEKLEDRDKQIKELQLNAGDNSVVPKVYISLSSEEIAGSTEELSHDEALREIQKQNATISELRNRVASLQTKMGTFEKTAAENSKMEQHGKEQSKVVMEWRQKYEAAEVDKAELTKRCVAQEHTCEHLKQENQHLLQNIKELDEKHNRLMAVHDTVTQQLSQMKEQAAEASDLKEEKDSLKTMLDEKAQELERQKIQAETYKEDFENERKDREAQASAYEDEKAAMSLQHQKIVDELKQQIEELKIKVGLKEATMKGECANLEEQIQSLNGELIKAQEQSEQDKDAVQVALAEKQSLEEILSKLDDKYREKEAHLEKALAHKSDLEDQLQKSRANHEHEVNELQEQLQQLRLKSTELQQLISKANEEVAAWRGDCQAKTQQVKQYSKQVEQFRVQVDGLTAGLRESRAKIAEYEHQLGFYQEQIRQLEEDNEQKDAVMKAKLEAEVLDVNRDLERLRGEKVMWEMTAKQAGDQRGAASTCDEQFPSTLKGRHPGVHPSGQQDMQGQGGDNVVRSLPQPNQYTSRDGAQDKSITSPAVVAPGQQPFEFNPQHQLVMSSGGIQHHHQQNQHAYARQGGMMVGPGQQNQYQQVQRSPQAWHGGQQGGGAAPDSRSHQVVHGHHGNHQNLMPQHGMGNINGASIGMEQQQQLGVATQESGQRHVPSGPQENPLLQGINTEMHNVAAVVGREVDNNPELQSFSPQAPLDPNLICPMCRQQFRIGEIQKYRQHVQYCHGT